MTNNYVYESQKRTIVLLRRRVAALEARVAELEREDMEWEKHGLVQTVEDNARLRAAFERAAELTCRGCADLGAFTPAEWSKENDRFIHRRVIGKSLIWCDASDIRVEMNK